MSEANQISPEPAPPSHGRRRRRERLNRLLIGCMPLILCLVMYPHFLRGMLPAGIDNTLFYCPFFSLAWDGGPPTWNPYSLGGMALDTNFQAALLYPLRWPFYFIADWRDYFGLFSFLHYAIAAWGMFVWMRTLRLGWWAALTGVVMYALGGHLAGRILNCSIFYAACWLPWLLAGGSGTRTRHALLTVLGAAMILTIGSPHLMFYGALGYAVVFAIGPLGRVWRGFGRRAAVCFVGWRLLCGLLAFAIAAPAIVPSLRSTGQSIRKLTTAERNLADSVRFVEVPRIVVGGTGAQIHPEYIDKVGYIGVLGMAIILGAACRRRTWRDRRWWIGWGLVLAGMFFALGKHVGLDLVMPYIPGYRMLMGAPRALVLAAAGFGLLGSLGVSQWSGGRMGRMAVGWLITGITCGVLFTLLAWRWQRLGAMAAPFADDWLTAWLKGPGAVPWPLYPLVDGAVFLVLGALVLWLKPARRATRGVLIMAVLTVQMLHFYPRVKPPLVEGEAFDPQPPVQYLMARQLDQPPFRVAGYSPLSMHSSDFTEQYKFHYLMPNLATLYRLHDIRGFDPQISLDYLALIEQTAGRAAYSDPIRNIELGRPDVALFKLLGVRYLIGNPFDRRVTHLPQVLHDGAPEQSVTAWEEAAITEPVTQWMFVSLIDGGGRLRPGAKVAELVVEASEGEFRFPVRKGIETGDLLVGSQFSGGDERGGATAPTFMEWSMPAAMPSLDYQLEMANYLGRVEFGQPLHIQRVRWELTQRGIRFNIASQACRLAAPADVPWRRVFGGEHDPFAVYELTESRPLAFVVKDYERVEEEEGVEFVVSVAELMGSGVTGGSITWVGRSPNELRMQVQTDRPGLLIFREKSSFSGEATLDGERVNVGRLRVADPDRLPGGEAALQAMGLGVEISAGRSEIVVQRPDTLVRSTIVIWGVLLIGGLGAWGWMGRRKRPRWTDDLVHFGNGKGR